MAVGVTNEQGKRTDDDTLIAHMKPKMRMRPVLAN
jgi:hypothetical protein